MSTKLWTKHANYYLVEALVGMAWTQIAKVEESEEKATEVAAEALLDRSVKSVRVQEHEIVHVCSEIMLEEAAPTVNVPRTMIRMGETGICRVCFKRTAIAQNKTDENDRWALCEAGHSLPLPNGK